MAASDYLSSKADGDAQAKKSAVYTGVAYLFTVIFTDFAISVVIEQIHSVGHNFGNGRFDYFLL